MSSCRFLYSNLITSESQITVSSLRNGIVSSASKDGTGSATLNTSGNFTGATDLEYFLEIDSILGGAEVGQATFKWSDGGGSWDATGVTTSATNILLNNGVYVNWTIGSGDDFVLADKWYFKAINLFNSGKMIDGNRDTRYRSAALGAPNTISLDLGTNALTNTLEIYDHNFTSTATITFRDDSSTFTEPVLWNAEKITHYLSTAQTAYHHWVIEITDALNPDGYIEIGELFLGTYLELTQGHERNPDRPIEYIEDAGYTPYGVRKTRFYNLRKKYNIRYDNLLEVDSDSLDTMFTAITSRTTGILKPIYWNEDSAYPNDTWLMNITGMPGSRPLNTLWSVSIPMEEVLRSI